MAQWLKKVGDTPIRSNGFIIDSFATNDNKEFNAPSIQAVEQRTDNNIIFGAIFSDVDRAGAHDDASICGFTVEGSDIDQFMKGYGMILNGQGTHTIKSPRFTGEYEANFETEPAFSLSLCINQLDYDTGEEERDPFIAKLENLTYPYNPLSLPVYEDTRGYFSIKIKSIIEGYLEIDFINTSDHDFSIYWLKFEQGSACTAPAYFNKDASTRDAILKAVNDLLLVEKYTVTYTTPLPPYAGAETGGALPIEKEGYRAVGVVGYDMKSSISLRTGHIMRLMDVGDRFIYVATNLTSNEKPTSFDVYILYKKIY